MEINGITIDGITFAGLIISVIAIIGLIIVYICEMSEKEYNHPTRVIQIVFQYLGLIGMILIIIGRVY